MISDQAGKSYARESFRPRWCLEGPSRAVIASLLALAIWSPAHAQETTTSTSPATALPDEIIVTAQRRRETVQDIPYNISAVSPTSLANAGAASVNDLTRVVAGLSAIDQGPVTPGNANNFTLRGLRTDAAAASYRPTPNVSSVSTYYGETPLFFSLLLKDLARVEVLRGPQGTLYGSGAQGGTIRFIPNRPSFDKVSGEFNASGSTTQYASSLNGSVDAVLNLPLSSNLALRISAAGVRYAGFIDGVNRYRVDSNGVPVPAIAGDLTSGPVLAGVDKDANSSKQWMVRAAVRYQPASWIDLEVAYLHQYSHLDDVQSVNPNYAGGVYDYSAGAYPNAPFDTRPGGPYKSTDAFRQPVTNKIDLVSANATVDFGFASLSSATSYYDSQSETNPNFVAAYVGGGINFLPYYNNYPRFQAPTPTPTTERGFVQEVRLVSQTQGPLSYVVGLYYERKTSRVNGDQFAPGFGVFSASIGNPGANPQLGDFIFSDHQYSVSNSKAVFGEVTYRITPKWQVTGGLRFFKDNFNTDFQTEFLFAGSGASATAGSNVSSHIFKLNTSYDFSTNTKVYATVSRGFRRGGTNPLPIAGLYASLPEFLSYKPDFATNYEVGLKGSMFGRRLQYSADIFLINLKDFQFNGLSPSALSATYNGKLARSKGVEIETSYRASSRLSLSLGYTFTDAKVVKGIDIFDLPPFALFTGDAPVLASSIAGGLRLPGVSKHSVVGGFDYAFPLAAGREIAVHMDGNYRSSQNSTVDPADLNFFKLAPVFTSNMRVTYDSGQKWTIALFANNITGAYGYSAGMGNQSSPNLFTNRVPIQPRTIGAAFHFSY